MKQLIQRILTFLARFYLWRYKPMIIAITGNVGKTSTKEAVAAVVRHSGKAIRASKGNLNNEFGVPLTILGDWADEYYMRGSSSWFWSRVLLFGAAGFIISRQYPEVLVLEFGADRPGDIHALTHWCRPHIAVVTAVGDVPVHMEFFESAEHVAREKSEILKHLANNDYAVLNYDDKRVSDMRAATEGHAIMYGSKEGAEIRFSNLSTYFDGNGAPAGVVFKLHNNGSFVPVKIAGSLGASHAYAVAAATGVGIALGMNLVEISQTFEFYRRPFGRLRLLPGIKDTTIIDDTYNAAPESTRIALDTLATIKTRRKIAVLGDMLELGRHGLKAHAEVGQHAAEVADIVVCVGEKARLIAEAAARKGMPADKIFHFHTSQAARSKVQELLEEEDVVLVKGSQGMRMERIVEEIMAEPERKAEFLVRQSGGWVKG